MNIKKRIAAGVVFSLFILFAATGFCQGDDRVGMDQWTRVTKEKTVGQAPDNFDSAMKRGNELAKDGRYKEAVEAFSNAVRFNPQSSEAYIGRGKARRAQKDFAGAMTDYEAAVNLKPGDKNLLITLANIKTDMRKYDEAAADLSRILASDPNNLDAVVSRGYARKQLKDYPGAKADFEKALALSPNHAFATRMLHSLGSAGQTLAPQQAQIKPLTKPLPTDATPSPSGPPPMSADLPSVAGRVPTPSPSVSAQNGKPVSPTPSLGASQAAAAGGVLQDFDPCKPDVNLSDLVWSSVEQPAQQANKPIENTSRFNDLLVFSKTRHNHPVTTAKAQLAYLMGDLSPAGQRKFDEKWSFFFQYPSDEANAYFEKMIPLLAELIKKRNQTTSAVLARDDALKDAGEAQAYGNAEVRANALMIAEQQKEILRELDGELKTLAASIEALGDPPNPLANACKSRKKHEEARKIVKDALKASIVPKKLKGETGVSYAFKPEVSEIEAGAKLHWDFGDGEVKEAPAGEVKHVFKKPGKFVIGLSLVSAATKTKVPVAEARALITGASAAVGGAGKKEDKQKFIFIEKEPFDISGLPDGCVVKVNKGEKEMPVHTGDPENTRFTFIANISCKEKIFEQGQASLEHLTKPVPFKIYATPATVTFSVDYFPPNNALYYKQTVVEGLQKLLANQQDMKRWGYEPYNFKGYGRIFGYGSVKNPLGASADRIRHEIDYYGVGQESTSIGFKINTLVGYSEDSFGIECKKDGHRCGNYEKNQIVDKFRNELREKLSVTRVTYYKDLEKFIAGIKLKSMPYAQTETDEGPAISPADLAWLDIDETGLQPEEILKRKQEALLEAEKFYRSNIEILQKNLSREQADYAREQDPDRKAAFFFRMMGIQADIQAEQDKINTLHTGKIAHTRTQYDDYVQNKFIERIKDEQEKYVKLERAAAIIRKEVNKLPPGEREKAAEFVDRHLTGKTLADLDEETIKKAGEAIFNKTQGYNEAEAAKYEEESYMWDDYLTRAERVKMAADIGMVGCSFLGGPMALSASYDISTGYFQGGIKEAATQLVLQTGAFALGKYVGAGSKAAAGADDAAAAAKAAARQSGKVSKGLSSAEELKIFQANRARGEKTVKEFENLNQSLKNAYLNKASQNEIAAIKKQIREKTIEIQADPHAKNFLKYQGDKLTQTRFNRSMKSVHKDVEKKFYEKMRKEPYKWGEFEIKEMRNASSAGSVGMDYDVGLIEKANFIKLPDGTMKRQYWLMRDGKPATRSLWQKEAQKCWNEAYEEVTLKNAERSWENLTTRIHPESYQDLAVLDGNMSKVSKDWIQQTADVTRFKAMHMLKDGSMSKFEKLQEISRGTAKDLNTKLLPVLGNMQKTKQVYAAAEHWKKVSSVLDDFGKNKIDPITAERRIAELTGGKSIPEVVDDMSYMMESFVKLRK